MQRMFFLAAVIAGPMAPNGLQWTQLESGSTVCPKHTSLKNTRATVDANRTKHDVIKEGRK
jgi:hypothetical protein